MKYRPEKVSSLLKEVISEIIMHELNDPIFKKFISITDVKMKGDLKKAIVYFRTFEEEPEVIERALNKAKGFIKKKVAEKIILKYMPDIEFKIDNTVEEEKKLEELFAKIHKKESL